MDLHLVKKPEVDYSFVDFNPSLWLAHRSFILYSSEKRLESETPTKEKYYQKPETICAQLNHRKVIESQC